MKNAKPFKIVFYQLFQMEKSIASGRILYS